MLHGHSQELDLFITGTLLNAAAAAAGFDVLYLAQSSPLQPQKFWHWFEPAHHHCDSGKPALLAAFTQSVIDTHAIIACELHVRPSRTAALGWPSRPEAKRIIERRLMTRP